MVQRGVEKKIKSTAVAWAMGTAGDPIRELRAGATVGRAYAPPVGWLARLTENGREVAV